MTHIIRQSADHLWMTEPVLFHCNRQTMETNSYQSEDIGDIHDIQASALAEFQDLRDRLVASGVAVTTVKGHPDSPDDIFPNWASTHVLETGERVIIYYPMLNENRRIERRAHLKEILERQYRVFLDMSHYESENRALESTSILWMDRINKVVYATLSARGNPALVREWADKTGYSAVQFETRSHVGKPVYHTDVMMSIGTGFACVCLESIVADDRARVLEALAVTGRDIIEITMDQLRAFCGNILEVVAGDGSKKLVMSGSAYRAYTDAQKDVFLKHVSEIIHADLPTIQTFGGGAARCMIMEMF